MKKNLKFYLKNKLSAKELALLPSSFDLVGDILIFSDFPKELSKKEKIIGEVILENYHSVKTVLKKTKKYSGRFRTPKLKLIAGEDRKETICKENNILLKLDVEKVYFSSRMSSERKRLAGLIGANETILVMFSGASPYPLVISKNTRAKKIVGIEINPIAHIYALENLKLNKIKNVELVLGDVKKKIPKLKKKFDRIIMPLPKGAENFLDLAFKVAKKGAFIHLYQFINEKEFDTAKQKLEGIFKEKKISCKILNLVKCGQSAPGFYRVCIDLKFKTVCIKLLTTP